MLLKIKSLEEYDLYSKDGQAGKVHEFYFDKNTWKIKYMVGNLRHKLHNKYILIEPQSFGIPIAAIKYFDVHFTKEQLEKCPEVHSLGLSMRPDYDLANYFTWPDYISFPESTLETEVLTKETSRTEQKSNKENSDLFSSKEIESLRIHAADDFIGHVDDLLVDESDWKIKAIIINTRHLLIGGKKVILRTDQVGHIDLDERSLFVNLNADEIRCCPEFHYSITD